MMQQQDIPCIICFNKQDIDEEGKKEDYRAIYEQAGFRTITVSAARQEGIDTIQELLRGKTTTVAGPSGVGKSSLVNCLQSGTVMETGSISEKIERGKHTTRHSELITIAQDTYILDTPGFSSLGLFRLEKEQRRNFIRSLPLLKNIADSEAAPISLSRYAVSRLLWQRERSRRYVMRTTVCSMMN